jgi:hypothetical protein
MVIVFSPVLAQEQEEWVLHLLWGRYSEDQVFGLQHYAILVGVFVVMAMSYVFFLNRRLNKYDIERRNVHMCASEDILDPEVVSSKTRKRAFRTTLKAERARRDTMLAAENYCGGDLGWGHAGERLHSLSLDGVNFNEWIAKSYTLVEEAALSRRPNLRHRHARTIRNYVATLEKEFPRLPPSLCQDYLRMYERAKFGHSKFTRRDFESFYAKFRKMHAIMSESSQTAAS